MEVQRQDQTDWPYDPVDKDKPEGGFLYESLKPTEDYLNSIIYSSYFSYNSKTGEYKQEDKKNGKTYREHVFVNGSVGMIRDEFEQDNVNHPSHYKTESGIEAIDVIEAFSLNFHRGNAVKYILRSGKKNDELEDLKKAAWYINREIERLTK